MFFINLVKRFRRYGLTRPKSTFLIERNTKKSPMGFMATVISIANQKGGVGKTTTAFNLGHAFCEQGFRVLLIDNDPQGNLTSYGVQKDQEHWEPPFTIDEVYVSRRETLLEKENFIPLKENLDLLAADSMLSGAEYYLMAKGQKEFVLKKALSPLMDCYDYVVIDNPPALNLLTVNGLVASHFVVVPVQLEFFSLEGIVLLEKTIESLQDKNPVLSILGIVPNMYDGRRKLNVEVLEALREQFGDKVFSSPIHNSVKIAESSGHGRSILSYAPSSRSSKEFLEIAQEVHNKCQSRRN